MATTPRVIAHRGASAAEPENTMAAFQRAVEQGADGIELDVHATADGHFAVVHDRFAGDRAIGELSLAAVRERTPLPRGEVVPDLADVLATFSGQVTLHLEVKSITPEGESALIALIRQAPRPEACQVHAFDHRIVKRLADRDPSLRCGALSSSVPLDPVGPVHDCKAAVLWQAEDLIDRELADAVHAAGLDLIAWTVDAPARIAVLAPLVDGLCTNTPDVARSMLG